jgi:LysM repeat protein
LALPDRRLPPTTPTQLAKVAWTTSGGGGLMITRPLAYAQNEAGRRVAYLAEAAALAALALPTASQAPAPVAEPIAVASAAPRPAPESVADADDATDASAKDVAAAPARGAKAKGAKQSVRYRVRSGDNLWTIARKYGVSVKDIRAWNSLHSEKLSQGQTLVLYVKK